MFFFFFLNTTTNSTSKLLDIYKSSNTMLEDTFSSMGLNSWPLWYKYGHSIIPLPWGGHNCPFGQSKLQNFTVYPILNVDTLGHSKGLKKCHLSLNTSVAYAIGANVNTLRVPLNPLFAICLNFQQQIPLKNQYLPYFSSENGEINSIKSDLPRAFQQHQEHP